MLTLEAMNPCLFKTSQSFVLVGYGISEENFLLYKVTSFEKWAGGSAPIKNIDNAKKNE